MYLNFSFYVASSATKLCGGLLQVGDQIISVLVLLETAKCHLCAGDVLLGIFKVREKGSLVPARSAYSMRLVLPCDPLLFVGVGILKALYLPSLTSEQSMQTIINARSTAPRSNVTRRLPLRADKGFWGTYFGPTLFPPEASVVWHCAHLVYRISIA
jgi:hypothetical protein